MPDFNVEFENNLDDTPDKVEVLNKNNGGWDPVGIVLEMGSEPFTISSDNDSITIKVAPQNGRKDHQVCEIKTCSLTHECDPPHEIGREGWTIKIKYLRKEKNPEPGTTTVEIRDNQP